MEKFSSYSKTFEHEDDNQDTLWSGDYVKIKNIDGWEAIIQNDCVVVLPHLIDLDEVLLRKESVPPFKYVDNKEFFLTALSGTKEEGESDKQTIIRELEEEAGIKLNSTYNSFKKWNELFLHKGCIAKCHIYYIPLYTYDYIAVRATGDGSKAENNSTTVRIDVKYLKNLNPSDLITSLLLQYFKNEIKE